MKLRTRSGNSKYEVLKREASEALDEKKTLFFIETNNIGSSDRPRFWQNLKTLMPKINFRSIPRNLSSEKFNAYFSTVASNIDKEFSDDNEPSWHSGTSTNNFSMSLFSTELVLKELTLLGNLPNLDILGMDRKLLYFLVMKLLRPCVLSMTNLLIIVLYIVTSKKPGSHLSLRRVKIVV